MMKVTVERAMVNTGSTLSVASVVVMGILRVTVDRKGKLNGARAEKTPPWRKTRRIKEDGDVMDMMY